MRASRMVRALIRALVVVAVVAVPALAADTVITAVSGGRFVTLEGKRVPSVKVFFTNGVIQKNVLTQSRVSKVVPSEVTFEAVLHGAVHELGGRGDLPDEVSKHPVRGGLGPQQRAVLPLDHELLSEADHAAEDDAHAEDAW